MQGYWELYLYRSTSNSVYQHVYQDSKHKQSGDQRCHLLSSSRTDFWTNQLMKQLAADTTQCCHCGSNSLLLEINIHSNGSCFSFCTSWFTDCNHVSVWFSLWWTFTSREYGCRNSTYRLLLQPECRKSGQEENLPEGEVGWRSAGLQQHSVCGYSAAGVQRGSCHSHFRAVEHIKPIIITWSTAH